MNRNKILRLLLLLSIFFLIIGCNKDEYDYLKQVDNCKETSSSSVCSDNQVFIEEPEPKQEDEVKIDLPKIDIDVECNKNKEGYLEYVHKTKETSFSFVHPEDWFFEEENVWDAGMASDGHLREASPGRGGVRFILDRETEGFMVIFGTSHRHYGMPESVPKKLVINGTKRGIVHLTEINNEVFIRVSYEREHTEGDGFHSPGIYLFMAALNKEFYDENKDAIWGIIGSLEFRFIKEESK